MRLKILSSAFFIAFTFLLFPGKIQASEGTVELASITETKTSCFAFSILMQNFQYKVIISCKNLVYPAPNGAFAYILWANPIGGGSPFKLGPVNFGKAEFSTRKPFNSLFLTSEIDDTTRTPSQFVVARGSVNALRYVDGKLLEEKSAFSQKSAETFSDILEEPTPSAEKQIQQKNQGFLGLLEKGGIALAVGIFVILIILAFITRSRG